MDVQYLDFIKAYNTFYPSILTAILVRYGMGKWMDKSTEKMAWLLGLKGCDQWFRVRLVAH